jgi:hypothetical protein
MAQIEVPPPHIVALRELYIMQTILHSTLSLSLSQRERELSVLNQGSRSRVSGLDSTRIDSTRLTPPNFTFNFQHTVFTLRRTLVPL